MKKAFCLLIVLAVFLSLPACSAEPHPAAVEYVPNSMAEVAVSYIFDGKANIATRPLTDISLAKITLACIYYDATGRKIGQMKLIDCSVKSHKNITLWQTECPENAVYVDSTVYSVEDWSGNEYASVGIDVWKDTVTAEFNTETYQDKLQEKLAVNADLATANAYAVPSGITWQNESVMVELDILSADVSAVYLFALWFDAFGQPVDTDACNYCKNGESMAARIDTDDNHNYLFSAPESARSAKLIVQSVELSDNRSWINPYCYEWIFLNQSIAK